MEDRFARRPGQPGAKPPPTDTTYINIREVVALTSLSRSTIYVYMEKQGFPRPYRLGLRAVRWDKAEVLEWLRKRERGGPSAPAVGC